MKSFDLAIPGTLESATRLLAEGTSGRGPEARERTKLLAGGQDLLGELKDHLAEPERVIDLKHLPGLDAVEVLADGGLAIGALVTLAELARHPALVRGFRVLAEAAHSVATPQIRNRATVGGNLCQRPRCWYYRNESTRCLKKGGAECFAYSGLNKYNAILGGGPSYIVHPSDLAPALVALGAEVVLRGRTGERRLALERFFTLPSEGSVRRENALAADEILTHVHVPAECASWRSTYVKFRERESHDFALGAVALALRFEGSRIAAARLCLGGVAPIPWRCASTERLLVGRAVDAETCTAAGADCTADAAPLEHNGYKVPLTQGLVRKALLALAGGGG